MNMEYGCRATKQLNIPKLHNDNLLVSFRYNVFSSFNASGIYGNLILIVVELVAHRNKAIKMSLCGFIWKYNKRLDIIFSTIMDFYRTGLTIIADVSFDLDTTYDLAVWA